MEALAKKLANNISISLGYDDEKRAVIAYGLIAFIQILVTVFFVLLFGLIFGVPVEALIVCFSASVLRKYSGGAHLCSAEGCTVFSVICCTSFAVLSRYVLLKLYDPFSTYAAVLIIFSFSFFTVAKLAPVDSPNKPINSPEKKEKMKYGSFIVLSVYLILSLLFLYSVNKHTYLKSYGISFLLGITWQIFTLTKPGAVFHNKLNTLLGKEVSQ